MQWYAVRKPRIHSTGVHVLLAAAPLCAAIPFDPAFAQELPIPCAPCGDTHFVTSGAATYAISGNVGNIDQTSKNVILNWREFNIGADSTVNFNQPSANASALNRIFQNDPSRIFGALNANGQVYLINQNGIIFGNGSQVNVHALIASTLPDVFDPEKSLSEARVGPAFADTTGTSKPITVESGAELKTDSGGRIFLFAPEVTNKGSIKTPDGQTALAAGSKVYVAAPTDANAAGLLIEVDGEGIVTNGDTGNATIANPASLLGQISAERGTVDLVGLAVNQLGRVSATTSVNVGGSVRLIARNVHDDQVPILGGKVRFGANSVTEVTPELASTDSTVDTSAQPGSQVQAIGHNIRMEQGSRITAPGGSVTLSASTDGQGIVGQGLPANDSRVLLEAGSQIDVSGSDATLSDSANSLTIKLQSAQLRDRPVQLNSTLKGQTVTVDLRRRGTLPNGQTWIGTPLADLNEAAEGVTRTVSERTSVGGTVNITSQGDVIQQQGATIDVSGGTVTYPNMEVQTTKLVRQGRIIDIGDADPNLVYDGIYGEGLTVEHHKWGVTEVFSLPGVGGGSNRSYIEGKDAGTVSFIAPNAVMGGSLLGTTTTGFFQRLAPTADFDASPLTRPYEQRAQRGRLVVGFAGGNDAVALNVAFGNDQPLSDFPEFDPTKDALPPEVDTVFIRPDLFGPDAMGRVDVFSSGNVLLPEGTTLDLGPGGTLNLTGRNIKLDGTISAQAGSVSATARQSLVGDNVSLTLGSRGVIDVRGAWVNDSTLLSPAPQHTFASTDGGKVSLSVLQTDRSIGEHREASLDLQAGSRIDATGGGWLQSNGTLQAGAGGSISLGLTARQNDRELPLDINLNGTLAAFGINKGGTLKLAAPNICIASAGCGGDPLSGTLNILPSLFEQGGFSSYGIVSNLGGVTVAAETRVNLRQSNLQLQTGFMRQATGTDILSFSDLVLLPDFMRSPVNLDITVNARNTELTGGWSNEILQAAGSLNIGTGARITADPGAAVRLTANTHLAVDGTIDAPAGEIALRLSGLGGNVELTEFLASQTLWLGQNSQLLARGTSVLTPNAQGLRQGQVLTAGKVSLTAASGYVVASAGSVIDVSGASVTLDLPAPALSPSGKTIYEEKQVAGAAGSIDITAAEGALLVGSKLRAAAADAPGAAGGSLTLTLDGSTRNVTNNNTLTDEQLALIVPRAPRTIEVYGPGGGAIATDVPSAGAVPLSLNGKALVADSDLRQGGFADITLRSRNLIYSKGVESSGVPDTTPGIVRFNGDVSLAAQKSVTVDAAGIASDGGHAVLNAPYVALGHSDNGLDPLLQQLPSLATGSGELTVNADLIDLVGTSRLLGLLATNLNSSGDIRMRGVRPLRPEVMTYTGSLETTGDLDLTASAVYPTTLSQFTLRQCAGAGDTRCGGNGDPAEESSIGNRIAIHSNGNAAKPILSAGGSLTIDAPTILQDGNVAAPLGKLTFKAQETLTFAAGSRTSTSAHGLTIPFGRVEIGSDWVYPVDVDVVTKQRLIFGVGDNHQALPSQALSLEGADVAIEAGAVIDQSGGGDLLASEFQPGLSGTIDVLSPNAAQKSYAILPASQLAFAPFDPLEYEGSGLKPGDSVELSASVGDLPAGRYVLLPARYALLPGAYLVTPTKGFQDLAAGVVRPQLDGSTLVSGRMTFGSTAIGDSRTSGFLIRAGQDISKIAQYDKHTANDFFAQQAQSQELAAPRLPIDAGTLTLTVGKSLINEGTLLGTPGKNGRGSVVEITGENIAIIADGTDTSSMEGLLALTASSLNAFGSESLLLGATASQEEGGRRLNVTARQVQVQSGAELTLPEIVIAATEKIQVDEGATVSGNGTASGIVDDLLVDGDGAVLRVSANPGVHLQRDNASAGTGALEVAEGARVVGGKSVLLDSSGDTRLAGSLETNGGSLALSANQISLGAIEAVSSGLALDNAALARLNARDLTLTSRSSLDLYGPVEANFDTLGIEAAEVRGFANDDATARFTASTVRLSNPDGVQPGQPDVADGTGKLEIVAQTVQFGSGAVAIDGFSNTEISASKVATALARTFADQPATTRISTTGDLKLSAPGLTAESSANLELAAAGTMHFAALDASGTDVLSSGLGARIALTGKSVLDEGRIVLPSGRVDLLATGPDATDGVRLAAGAVIDVAGSAKSFVDKLVAAPAGTVSLQANQGNVSLEAGSTVDVSAGKLADGSALTVAGASAGSLKVSAAHGEALLAGTVLAKSPDATGSFGLDVGKLTDFSVLNSSLNAAGFGAERSVRVRTGDIAIAASDVIQAREVQLTADAGGIDFAGRIAAAGVKAGRVLLSAFNDIILRQGSRIDAGATGKDMHGGSVALNSAQGGVQFQSGASIDVSPGASADPTVTAAVNLANRGGTLDIRMSRDALLSLTDANLPDRLALNGQLRGARQTTVEGYKAYAAASPTLDFAETDPNGPYIQDALAFITTNAQLIEQALGRNDELSFRIVPGIEIDSADSLTLASNWDLSPNNSGRFTYQKQITAVGDTVPTAVDVKVPGALTLRSAGDLTFNGSLSDGFDGVADIADIQGNTVAQLLTTDAGGSWSYRLIAGADTSSANLMAVHAATATELTEGVGNFNLGTAGGFGANGRAVVRTGTGSIDVAAARNVVFGDGRSVMYTAGTDTDAAKVDGDPTKGIPLNIPGTNVPISLGGRPYPESGGDVRVAAGGNIDGVGDQSQATTLASKQLINDWLYRAGNTQVARNINTGWTVAFERFQQGIGALGGGNVSLDADGSVRNMSAVVPTIGRQVGSADDPLNNRVNVIGGGDLAVRAGSDITSGVFFVGRGNGVLDAGGSITSGRTNSSTGDPIYTVLAVADSVFDVHAGTDLHLQAVVNPTLLPPGVGQRGLIGLNNSYFSTYSPGSGVRLTSLSGNVLLHNNAGNNNQAGNAFTLAFTGQSGSNGSIAMTLLAPTLEARSLGGNIMLENSATLFPSPQGQLELLAKGDVRLSTLNLSDADLSLLPTPERPLAQFADTSSNAAGQSPNTLLDPGHGAAVFAARPVHLGDEQPVRMVALEGDIANTSATGAVFLSKSAQLWAGRDIANLSLIVQNVDPNDVTSLHAEGDIRFPILRGATDGLVIDGGSQGIDVYGPGRLLLEAGGDIDLGASHGVSTAGNLVNPALPASGASIDVIAGLHGKQPQYAKFAEKYFGATGDYAKDVQTYVRTYLNDTTLSDEAALAAFANLPLNAQRPMILRAFYKELSASGRANDVAPVDQRDYTRGFDAIETLFPGEEGTYQGDLDLFFSRIYTLADGDINILTPGGSINVGLATPPEAFGVNKQASDLGVVARASGNVQVMLDDDFEVNQSRVFAADGGSILVWSSRGDIDAGRGAKTSISAPPATIRFNPDTGLPILTLPPVLTGSGFRTAVFTPGRKGGDVQLIAPGGVINVNEAGITSAGDVFLSAPQVIGANNIEAAGNVVGAPVDTGGLGSSLAGASAVGNSANAAASSAVESNPDAKSAPIAQAALSWLDVFVEGFGEDVCKAGDQECLKRQQEKQ